MNKKIKQAVAIALALVMCAGALLHDPHPVMAAEQYPVLSNGFVFSDISHNGGGYDGYIRNWYISNLESTDAVYALAYYDSCDAHDATAHAPQYYYLFSSSAFSFDRTIKVDPNGTTQKDEIVTNHFSSVTDHTGTLKGCFYPFSVSKVGQKITDYPIGYDAYKGNLSAYEVMNKILAGEDIDGIDGGISSYERDTSLGALQDIDYRKIYTKKNGLADKLFYRFTWNRKTSTDVDLSLDGYDVLYYWECYSIEKTFTGKIKQSDSLFTDKKLVKGTQDNYYTILQNAYEGQLYDIYKKVYDTQPAITKDFDVITVLHVAPAYKDSIFAPIKYGLWSHVTFDNAGTARTVQETVSDLKDGNGLEAGFDIETENEDGTSDTTHNKNTVGVGNDVDEAVNNSDHGNDTIFDSDFVDSFKDFDLSSLGNILNQLGDAASAFADLLGVVFGWMPTWVRGSLIAAVCTWIFMLIKRAIF